MSITEDQIYHICELLDNYKPKSILELGAGVSSQIFIDYSNENNAQFLNIENANEWLTSHSIKCDLKEYSTYRIDDILFDHVNYYEGLINAIKDRKYDFVFVDGPKGYETCYTYTRIQLLEIIPYLSDNCIVMIHDTERESSKRILEMFEKKIIKDYTFNKIDEHLPYKNMTEYQIKRRSN